MCETAVVGERISRLRNKNNDCAVRREEEKGNEPPFRCGVHCRLAASLSFCKRVGAWKGGTSLNYRFTPKKKTCVATNGMSPRALSFTTELDFTPT